MSFWEFLGAALGVVFSREVVGSLIILASWACLFGASAYGGLKLVDSGHGKWNWLFVPGVIAVSALAFLFGLWRVSYA